MCSRPPAPHPPSLRIGCGPWETACRLRARTQPVRQPRVRLRRRRPVVAARALPRPDGGAARPRQTPALPRSPTRARRRPTTSPATWRPPARRRAEQADLARQPGAAPWPRRLRPCRQWAPVLHHRRLPCRRHRPRQEGPRRHPGPASARAPSRHSNPACWRRPRPRLRVQARPGLDVEEAWRGLALPALASVVQAGNCTRMR